MQNHIKHSSIGSNGNLNYDTRTLESVKQHSLESKESKSQLSDYKASNMKQSPRIDSNSSPVDNRLSPAYIVTRENDEQEDNTN